MQKQQIKQFSSTFQSSILKEQMSKALDQSPSVSQTQEYKDFERSLMKKSESQKINKYDNTSKLNPLSSGNFQKNMTERQLIVNQSNLKTRWKNDNLMICDEFQMDDENQQIVFSQDDLEKFYEFFQQDVTFEDLQLKIKSQDSQNQRDLNQIYPNIFKTQKNDNQDLIIQDEYQDQSFEIPNYQFQENRKHEIPEVEIYIKDGKIPKQEQDAEKFRESLKNSLKKEEEIIEELIESNQFNEEEYPSTKKYRDFKENIQKLIELAKLNKITITLQNKMFENMLDEIAKKNQELKDIQVKNKIYQGIMQGYLKGVKEKLKNSQIIQVNQETQTIFDQNQKEFKSQIEKIEMSNQTKQNTLKEVNIINNISADLEQTYQKTNYHLVIFIEKLMNEIEMLKSKQLISQDQQIDFKDKSIKLNQIDLQNLDQTQIQKQLQDSIQKQENQKNQINQLQIENQNFLKQYETLKIQNSLSQEQSIEREAKINRMDQEILQKEQIIKDLSYQIQNIEHMNRQKFQELQNSYDEQIITIKNSESFQNISNFQEIEKKNEVDKLKLMIKITIAEKEFTILEHQLNDILSKYQILKKENSILKRDLRIINVSRIFQSVKFKYIKEKIIKIKINSLSYETNSQLCESIGKSLPQFNQLLKRKSRFRSFCHQSDQHLFDSIIFSNNLISNIVSQKDKIQLYI